MGRDGVWLPAKLDAPETPAAVKGLTQVQLLRQVWAQRFEVVERQAVWREKVETPGAQVIHTPHDPEVRYSEKHGQGWEGYKVHIPQSCDEERPRPITDVRTTLATVADHSRVAPIQAALAERDLKPAGHGDDTSYVTGATPVESRRREIELLGPVRLAQGESPRYMAALQDGSRRRACACSCYQCS